jgi:hypothetical protein
MENTTMTSKNRYYNFKTSLNSKAKLLTLNEISKMKVDGEAYVSIYSYNDSHKKKVEETGSISGIKDVTTNTLVFDFDSTDIEKARQDVLTLGARLVDQQGVNPEDIACYFSGGKGFHLVVPLVQEITPDQFKAAVTRLAEDLPTFDSVVSDPQRILRMEYTRHPKSGLYKIPLHIAEVDEMSVDQIKELAKTPREDYEHETKPVSLPISLFEVKEKKKDTKIDTSLFNPKSAPKGWKPYKWALAEGFFTSGERHQALMVIAATCRGLGYDKTTTYHICKSSIEKQAERYGTDKFDKEELYKNIIEDSVFSDGWDGGQYSPATNPWLKKYCERMGLDSSTSEKEDKVVQLDDIEVDFTHYVKHIEENTILTGIPSLDKAMPLTIGMNLGVIGAPSSGKTALALSILKNTSEAGVISVFASLDMHRNRLFEKLLYKVSGLSRDDLYKKIKAGEAGEIFKKVKNEYKNVYFYDRSSPTVLDIRSYITKVEEQTGKKVKLVMLDYFERVNSERSDETAASKDVSGQLQDLVNDFSVCMVTLVQPNKFAISGGAETPLLNYSAIKGSSFISQAFRAIISIWRPFFNPEWAEYDKFLKMAILKNDLGELDVFNFGWSGKKGDIWELTEEGVEEMERIQKMKDQKKADDASNDSEKDWR